MAANQSSILQWAETTNPFVTHYELVVLDGGVPQGAAQVIPLDDSVDGVDNTAGFMEIQFSNITELPQQANGSYTFHIYTVDALGRSESPYEIWNVPVDFTNLTRLLPAAQNKTGILLKNSTQPFYDSAFPAGDRA